MSSYIFWLCLSQWEMNTCTRESTKHGPLVHGLPQWTRSMDRVHQKYGPGPWTPFMDRVHGPPIMDRVHGPPIFTTPKITEVNKNKIKISKWEKN